MLPVLTELVCAKSYLGSEQNDTVKLKYDYQFERPYWFEIFYKSAINPGDIDTLSTNLQI